MTETPTAIRHAAPPVVRSMDVGAKIALLILLAIAIVFPDLGHMRGKAAGLRAVTYPMLAFTVPVLWYVFWRDRASFPWLADLLISITCFTDTLGNRMNMYDTIEWFDDWMHFMNMGLLTAGIILLTLHHTSSFRVILERALAFAATAAIGWEIAEYYAFISTSDERRGAYTDTLGDLGLGVAGAVVAAVVVHTLWHHGRLASAAPQLEPTST